MTDLQVAAVHLFGDLAELTSAVVDKLAESLYLCLGSACVARRVQEESWIPAFAGMTVGQE